MFIHHWNGVSLLPKTATPRVHVVSDASGSWGAAACWDNEWFQIAWSDYPEFKEALIAAKELLSFLVAVATWGNKWQSEMVLCHCDNEAVVYAIKGDYTRQANMAHMLCSLFFLEASNGFHCTAKHLFGVQNRLADALSRNNTGLFKKLAPGANKEPTLISPSIVHGLITSQAWTAALWSEWFANLVHPPATSGQKGSSSELHAARAQDGCVHANSLPYNQ